MVPISGVEFPFRVYSIVSFISGEDPNFRSRSIADKIGYYGTDLDHSFQVVSDLDP